MSKDGPWMNAEELEGWGRANGRAPESQSVEGTKTQAGDPPARKLSANKLALALLASASQGNAGLVKALLDQGSEVNCRTRALPGKTPYRIAIENGHDDAALVLLQAGGFPEPDNCYYLDAEESVAFTEGARNKKFSPEMTLSLAASALMLFIKRGKSWKRLTQAQGLLPLLGPRDDAKLMRACFAEQRLDLVLQGFRAGAQVDRQCWEASGGTTRWTHGLSRYNAQDLGPLLGLLAEPAAVSSMDPFTCENLFRAAMLEDDVRTTRALLDAGLRPSADWTMPEIRFDSMCGQLAVNEGRQGFLALAAAREKPEMWDLAKRCPPAVDAAKRYPEGPASLRALATLRLQEYAELAPIDARGPEGRALPHYWALGSSREPRDGWATLARKFPELFEARDDGGQTGYSLQASRLDPVTKDAFLSSLARIEKREVARFVPAKSAPAPKARSRL